MFNGKILRELIANAGLTKKEFEKQMFGSKSTDLYHLENAKNLRSDTWTICSLHHRGPQPELTVL